MQGFVFIYNKQRNTHFPFEIIKDRINNLKGVKHQFNIISNERLTLIYYTNEFITYPYDTQDYVLACPIGHFTEDKNILIQKLTHQSDSTKKEIISRLPGAFLMALGNLKNNTIDIFTHITNIESAYYYETDYKVIIGSDPLVISALSNETLKPEFDPQNFISFFELGYFADDKTPFKNVFCLPVNSHIKVEDNVINITSIDDSYSKIFTEDLDEDFNTILTNAFLESFNTIPDHSTLSLGLTGGKDSRMIFNGLLKKKYNLETFTSGFPENPDVIIAKQLADYYGISHKTRSPIINDDKTLEVNLTKRLVDSMKATSGQIYAYENIPPLTDFKNSITVNGVAGEILRGGYIIPESHSTTTDKSKLVNKFYRFSDMYNDSNNIYAEHLDNMKNNNDDYLTSLYKHYLIYKCGRWSSDSRKGKGYITENYMPFLDNQFVKLIMKIRPNELFSGKLQFNLLKSLDEQAVNFRFETTRFNFEKSTPMNNDYKGWYNRRPMYPTSKIGKYNWRILANGQEQLINGFREILLSDKSNPIFDVVNINRLNDILDTEIEYKYGKFVWALASMSTYINYINNNTFKYNDNIVRIDIPGDEVKKTAPKASLLNLNNKFVPLNDSLVTSQSDDLEDLLIKSVSSNKNRYLKTFEGKFENVPYESEDASLENVKSIRVNVTLDYTHDKLFLYVVLYSKEQRETNIKLEPKLINNKLVFDTNISLEEEITRYRLALKFPNTDERKSYLLKYAFIEFIINV